MKSAPRIDPGLIAFDFDGVIADTFRLFVNLARQNYGVEIDYEAIGDYEFTEALDLPPDQTQGLIDDLTYRSHELGLEPIGDALKTLARLSAQTSPLIVTARPVSEPVAIWLSERLPRALPHSRHRQPGGQARRASGQRHQLLHRRPARYLRATQPPRTHAAGLRTALEPCPAPRLQDRQHLARNRRTNRLVIRLRAWRRS
jgi:hypothetical protein